MSEQRPRVYVSELTGRAWVTTRYKELPLGALKSEVKHDVTEDVVHHLMAQAWARGWNECNAATEGEAPPNPYRPAPPPTSDSERSETSRGTA